MAQTGRTVLVMSCQDDSGRESFSEEFEDEDILKRYAITMTDIQETHIASKPGIITDVTKPYSKEKKQVKFQVPGDDVETMMMATAEMTLGRVASATVKTVTTSSHVPLEDVERNPMPKLDDSSEDKPPPLPPRLAPKECTCPVDPLSPRVFGHRSTPVGNGSASRFHNNPTKVESPCRFPNDLSTSFSRSTKSDSSYSSTSNLSIDSPSDVHSVQSPTPPAVFANGYTSSRVANHVLRSDSPFSSQGSSTSGGEDTRRGPQSPAIARTERCARLSNEVSRLSHVINKMSPEELKNVILQKLQSRDSRNVISLAVLLPPNQYKVDSIAHCVRCHKEYNPQNQTPCILQHPSHSVSKVSQDNGGGNFKCTACHTNFRLLGMFFYDKNVNAYMAGFCFKGAHTSKMREVQPSSAIKSCEDSGCVQFFV